MTTQKSAIDTQNACEKLLRDSRQYNLDNGCWPSQTRIIDRLLKRGTELQGAYQELHQKLAHHPRALDRFLAHLLDASVMWNPEKMKAARADRERLVEVNRQIDEVASMLSGLLEERNRLHNHSGFSGNTHYHICEVIEEASEHNPLFRMEVGEEFKRLHYQYDLKYWPNLSDIMDALSMDAQNVEIEASDPLTRAATESSRSSNRDFLRAFTAAIEESKARPFGPLPANLRITDATMASLTNCALDLAVDQMITAETVKRFRQGERERER